MKLPKDFKQEFLKVFGKARREGFSVREIKERLQKQGYDSKTLNTLVINYYLKRAAKITAFTLALIILLILLTYFLLPEACDTPACFIKAANECDPKIYENEEAGSIIKYQITSDCFLIKRVLEVAETEPQRIHDMFLGKLMVCDYADKFNPGFFKLAWGLEYCEGPLKDAILAVFGSVCPEPCESALTSAQVLEAAAGLPLTQEAEQLFKDYLPYLLAILGTLLLGSLLYYFYKLKQEKK